MAGGGGEAEPRSLEQTPTWAVAIVCLGFVLISITLEQSINLIAKWLEKHHKKALGRALEKIKAELMILGFISLLLAIGQRPISEICISKSLGDTLLPCSKEEISAEHTKVKFVSVRNHRKLMHSKMLMRHILEAAVDQSGHCAKIGKVPLISQDGLHQLHIFIFALAVFHVLSCIMTMALGQTKMNKWKTWEQETKTWDYEFSNDPAKFRVTRDTTFGRRHLSFWSRTPIFLWIVCFFRQFVRSVPKVDYLTLRHGFILAHFAPHSRFDFQKYINRSLEDDFNVIVSISPPLWFFAVLFIFLNGHGWLIYLWLAFVPLILLVIAGTKLQVIITTMALQIQDRNAVVQGPPVVEPNDQLFWFSRPRWILYLIHFTLFQSALQFAFFFWAWYEFGLKSCFHHKTRGIISRISVGIVVQILCSYVTLPLYALVTQMGSNMKTTIFDERVAECLKRWHKGAKRNVRRNKMISADISNGRTTPVEGSSPMPRLLRRYKSTEDLSQYELSSEIGMNTPSPPCRPGQKATACKEHLEGHPDKSALEVKKGASWHLPNKEEEDLNTQQVEVNSSDFSFAY
ncbi:hypothetical protein SUGI_0311700 [Cryptomeria japonica]|uniref:MLO-like protein 12 n=1 Tax=Cryptomeria japonica TaxID=3369 RepID=UPI002408B428|nr:MLO-like protein 12 [Cryptomeria japonica]GLJ17824.1 hypothetical protein SUGI_0311700 [Cryptomeria japonica]